MKAENEKNDIVILDLDRPRELKFTHLVMKRYCAATGTKMSQIQDSVEDYENMTLLIYEMLRREDPQLTPEKCDELLDMISIGEILQNIEEAFQSLQMRQKPIVSDLMTIRSMGRHDTGGVSGLRQGISGRTEIQDRNQTAAGL